jgi:hypothetical protein
MGKKENSSSLSWARAFVVVNRGSQDIVVHLSQNPLSAHRWAFSRDTWRDFFTAVEKKKNVRMVLVLVTGASYLHTSFVLPLSVVPSLHGMATFDGTQSDCILHITRNTTIRSLLVPVDHGGPFPLPHAGVKYRKRRLLVITVANAKLWFTVNFLLCHLQFGHSGISLPTGKYETMYSYIKNLNPTYAWSAVLKSVLARRSSSHGMYLIILPASSQLALGTSADVHDFTLNKEIWKLHR